MAVEKVRAPKRDRAKWVLTLARPKRTLEAKERIVELPEQDPDVFALFVHWLYFKTIPVAHDNMGAEEDVEYMELAKAYVLGDMLVSPAFKNVAIDIMVEKSLAPKMNGSLYYPKIKVIQYIHSNTLNGSKIRRLLVDLYLEHGMKDWLRGETDIPPAFLLALVEDCLDQRERDSEWIKPERYHSTD
ncbi:hypothetical protein BDW74DRAFT_179053 [Aspergillus multicolor]|uniref:BTB/POZ domain-containing protein n=1 Tax=Aspergillus multicolor TaxID=41759 RepID=UPI003CCE2500